MTIQDLYHQTFKEAFYYDPTSPTWFRHSYDKNRKTKAGDHAGRLKDTGHYELCLDGKFMASSRLAYMLGYDRDLSYNEVIWFNDGNPKNLEIENLTAVSNQMFRLLESYRNGYSGVEKLRSGKYGSTIKLEDKRIWLGSFGTQEEARDAYRFALVQYLYSNGYEDLLRGVI